MPQVGRGLTVRTMSSLVVQLFFVRTVKRRVAEDDVTEAVVLRLLGAAMVAEPLTTDQVVEVTVSPGAAVALPVKLNVVAAPVAQRD